MASIYSIFIQILTTDGSAGVFGVGEGVLAQLSPPGEATGRSKLSDRGTQGTWVDAAIA